MDYSATILSKSDERQLKRCARGEILRGASVSPVLIRCGLIVPYRVSPDGQGGFITDGYRINANAYAEYQQYIKMKRRSSWKETRRFWIPIILSNLIALASLLVSLLALVRNP